MRVETEPTKRIIEFLDLLAEIPDAFFNSSPYHYEDLINEALRRYKNKDKLITQSWINQFLGDGEGI